MSLASANQPSVLSLTGRDTALADAANYYVATNPTPGTGIITGNPTSLVETTPALVVYNGGLLNVYLFYLRLSSTVVGGGAATKNFTHSIDAGNRFSSGGTALSVNNTNALTGVKSAVSANFGAVTATNKSNLQRPMGNDWFRVALADVVGDVYEFQYGDASGSAIGSSPATVANFMHAKPAICLPPNSSYVLNIWSGTFTQGITFEVELGFAEK